MSRQIWGAPERNKGPILEQLRAVLPAQGTVLEIASGTGQHVVHFAAALPQLHWQPTDLDPDNLASIAAWRDHVALPNISVPLALDVTAPWPVDSADALLNSNLIHIAPWEVTEALFRGAATVLRPRSVAVLYGPYKRDGVHTAPSNASFDQSLRERNPSWGVRDLADVVAVADEAGFELEDVVEMPANNLLCVYRKG